MFNGTPIILHRGEFITSLSNFSQATGMTERQTRTFWKHLKNDKQVVKISTKRMTKLIVCNYDVYQGERQSECQTNDKQTTTDKNEKNEKKERDFPSPEEITQYCKEIGYDLDGQFIYDYYQDLDFKDTKGNPIKNWKNKVRNVWCKPENRINGTTSVKANLYKPND